MSEPSHLQPRRFLFITGKGGVGKTTVMATYALALASQGKRVLCAMCQAKDRLSTLLGSPPIGDEIMPLRIGVDAVNIEPEAALREYGMMVLRVKALHRMVFNNALVTSFFRATPGLYSWAMLGKAWYHSMQKMPGSRRLRYDVVLLDAPSTGHALEMLRGPKVIVDVAPPGLLRREAVKAWNMFSDQRKFGVVLVTLPEEMPVTETLELCDALHDELRLPIAQIIVNGLIPPIFSSNEREQLIVRQPDSVESSDDVLWLSAVHRAMRENMQLRALQRLQNKCNQPMLYLPYRFDGADSPAVIKEFAQILSRQKPVAGFPLDPAFQLPG